MPYVRCPNCGLLAHVIPTERADTLHCPRCRSHEQEIRPTRIEGSRQLSTPPEDDRSPDR